MHDYVNWLRHASPYINAHRDCTFVVMLPGDGVAHPNFGNIVHDLVLLHSLGVRLVLVHGSRPQIEARLSARGLTPHFHRDLRVTDGPTLECVIDAVGQLRIAIEARLSMDMAASPMHGARLRVASGNFVTARPIGVVDGIDYHHTGEVRRIDRKGIGRLLDERSIVLLSSLGYSPTGEIFNVACEDVATRAAIDLGADKLLLFSPERGLLDEQGKLVRELRPQQVPAYLARLGNSYQAELLDAAAQACRGGVKRAHIVGYADDGSLLTELFTRDGGGTLVDQEQFESLREATIEDVGGLIELISPLEEQGILVRRSREACDHEWGLFCPLYALHSERSLGSGDLTDLRTLAGWQASLGGRVVGSLPLPIAGLLSPEPVETVAAGIEELMRVEGTWKAIWQQVVLREAPIEFLAPDIAQAQKKAHDAMDAERAKAR